MDDIARISEQDGQSKEGAQTLTRVQLRQVIYDCCIGLSREDAEKILEIFIDELASALQRSEAVQLRAFGNFRVREKRARVGRNPKTMIEAPIRARRVLTFKPSSSLTARVNGRTQEDE